MAAATVEVRGIGSGCHVAVLALRQRGVKAADREILGALGDHSHAARVVDGDVLHQHVLAAGNADRRRGAVRLHHAIDDEHRAHRRHDFRGLEDPDAVRAEFLDARVRLQSQHALARQRMARAALEPHVPLQVALPRQRIGHRRRPFLPRGGRRAGFFPENQPLSADFIDHLRVQLQIEGVELRLHGLHRALHAEWPRPVDAEAFQREITGPLRADRNHRPVTDEPRALRLQREAIEAVDGKHHPPDAGIVVGHGEILLEGELRKQMPLSGRDFQARGLGFRAGLHRPPDHRHGIRPGWKVLESEIREVEQARRIRGGGG